MTQRDVSGFAIGGLSGGEEKNDFWRMVTLSTDHLPQEKPRYLMGVGYVSLYKLTFITNEWLWCHLITVCDVCMCCRYAVDLVVCVALGCDMFDCVFPTRTAVSALPPVLKDKLKNIYICIFIYSLPVSIRGLALL